MIAGGCGGNSDDSGWAPAAAAAAAVGRRAASGGLQVATAVTATTIASGDGGHWRQRRQHRQQQAGSGGGNIFPSHAPPHTSRQDSLPVPPTAMNCAPTARRHASEPPASDQPSLLHPYRPSTSPHRRQSNAYSATPLLPWPACAALLSKHVCPFTTPHICNNSLLAALLAPTADLTHLALARQHSTVTVTCDPTLCSL